MPDRFRLTMAQLESRAGDVEGNAARAFAAWEQGRAEGADLVCLPEMHLSGAWPQNLAPTPACVEACLRAAERLAEATRDGPALGIGMPTAGAGRPANSWALLAEGRLRATVGKHHLATCEGGDETRIYESCDPHGPVAAAGVRLGVPIGEDARHPDVAETQAESGAEMLVVPGAWAYARGGRDLRVNRMVQRVVETGLPLVHLNRVGGEDDRVFDGESFVLNRRGRLAAQLPAFEEAVATLEFERDAEGWVCLDGPRAALPDEREAEYRAMVVATRDRARRAGASGGVLELSGGAGPALAAAIAADALGPEAVRCVAPPPGRMPEAGPDDAAAVARALGSRLEEVPTGPALEALEAALARAGAGEAAGEDLAGRLRGLMLATLAERLGALLLTARDKSEAAVGRGAPGDGGGWNPIGDLYRTRVLEACRWRNANHRGWMRGPAGEVVPARIMETAADAERRGGGEDGLPPQPLLDAILERLIERDLPAREIVQDGFERENVEKVERLLHMSEFKRFGSGTGPRLTRRALRPDRRRPVANPGRDRG